MLARLVSNSGPQVICLPWPPKVLRLLMWATVPGPSNIIFLTQGRGWKHISFHTEQFSWLVSSHSFKSFLIMLVRIATKSRINCKLLGLKRIWVDYLLQWKSGVFEDLLLNNLILLDYCSELLPHWYTYEKIFFHFTNLSQQAYVQQA